MVPRLRQCGWTRAFRVAIVVLGPAVAGVLSVALRQDNNWDLRNYHYYIPYAFLTNRLGVDIGPASIQTFLNPVLDVPFFWLIEHLSPRWVGFTLGAIQGLVFSLAVEIAWRVWNTGPGKAAESVTGAVFALVCGGLGVYGAGAASELGTTLHDLTLAPLILGSLAVLVKTSSRPPIGTSFLAAGFLLGIAVGLKQTSGIYVPGMVAALLAHPDSWGDRARSLARWSAGLAAGTILAGGYWMYVLYTQLGTPIGPFFNAVFRSPYFPPTNFYDARFFPKTHFQTLFYPFYFHGRAVTVMEQPFQDIRWAVLYLLLAATAVFLIVRQRRDHRVRSPVLGDHRTLLIFAVVSYLVWQYLFSIYRYLVALEVLCPILIYLCLCALIPRDQQTRLAICMGLFVLIAAAVRIPNWGRVPWSESFFGVEVPRLSQLPNAVVLMVGSPTAFVIPAFPKEARFVRVDRMFSADRETQFRDIVASLVREHPGNFYLLWQRQTREHPDQHLVPYGLRANLDMCDPVKNNADPDIVLCGVSRTAGISSQQSAVSP